MADVSPGGFEVTRHRGASDDELRLIPTIRTNGSHFLVFPLLSGGIFSGDHFTPRRNKRGTSVRELRVSMAADTLRAARMRAQAADQRSPLPPRQKATTRIPLDQPREFRGGFESSGRHSRPTLFKGPAAASSRCGPLRGPCRCGKPGARPSGRRADWAGRCRPRTAHVGQAQAVVASISGLGSTLHKPAPRG